MIAGGYKGWDDAIGGRDDLKELEPIALSVNLKVIAQFAIHFDEVTPNAFLDEIDGMITSGNIFHVAEGSLDAYLEKHGKTLQRTSNPSHENTGRTVQRVAQRNWVMPPRHKTGHTGLLF